MTSQNLSESSKEEPLQSEPSKEELIEELVRSFEGTVRFIGTKTLQSVMKTIVVELDYRENCGL